MKYFLLGTLVGIAVCMAMEFTQKFKVGIL